jgi:DNA-binding CsgD family transcriptional regulator
LCREEGDIIAASFVWTRPAITALTLKRFLHCLIERPVQLSLDTLRIAAKFQLTQRERETLEFVVQGYTSKEIADRMQISPNTVKAFIRIIMIKTGTTTRSGIIGKVLALKSSTPWPARSPQIASIAPSMKGHAFSLVAQKIETWPSVVRDAPGFRDWDAAALFRNQNELIDARGPTG